MDGHVPDFRQDPQRDLKLVIAAIYYLLVVDRHVLASMGDQEFGQQAEKCSVFALPFRGWSRRRFDARGV